MIIKVIKYDPPFAKEFRKLPEDIRVRAIKAESLFRINAFHPSLRLHKLKGKLKDLWSISIHYKYRIIFKVMEEGEILFISIGKHSIYN